MSMIQVHGSLDRLWLFNSCLASRLPPPAESQRLQSADCQIGMVGGILLPSHDCTHTRQTSSNFLDELAERVSYTANLGGHQPSTHVKGLLTIASAPALAVVATRSAHLGKELLVLLASLELLQR